MGDVAGTHAEAGVQQPEALEAAMRKLEGERQATEIAHLCAGHARDVAASTMAPTEPGLNSSAVKT